MDQPPATPNPVPNPAPAVAAAPDTAMAPAAAAARDAAPASAAAPGMPASLDPITKFVLSNRPIAALVLALLGVVVSVGMLIFIVRAVDRHRLTDPKKDKTEQKVDDPLLDDVTLEKPTGGGAALNEEAGDLDPVKPAISLGLMMLGLLTAAAWLYFQPVPPDQANRSVEGRGLTFALGAILGLPLFLLGVWLLYGWFGILHSALVPATSTEKAPIWKPLLAVLIGVLGLGLTFAGAQAARPEERNNAPLRKLVYAVNLFFMLTLVLVGLVIINVVTSLKLPNRLDTSERGFYTLNQTTTDYLGQLQQDVTVYIIAPEDNPRVRDLSRMMDSFRNANPGRVQVKNLSPSLDTKEIDSLAEKYPVFNKSALGVLIVTSAKENNQSFLRIQELFTNVTHGEGKDRFEYLALQAEGRIIREILFLTEAAGKPVVYFTQGAGELAIERGPPDSPIQERLGLNLKTALQADGCEVRPLRIDPQSENPRVPEDASIVVVADPMTRLNDATVNAIRQFMLGAGKTDAKQKGKLVLMAGAHPKPGDPNSLLATGLEELLGEYGARPGPYVVYGEATDQLPPNAHLVKLHNSLIEERTALGLTYAKATIPVVDGRPIEYTVNPAQPGPFAPRPFLHTFEDRICWLESAYPLKPLQAYRDFIAGVQARRPEVLSKLLIDAERNRPRPSSFAALISERDGTTMVNRAVIFGFGDFFEDQEARQPGAGVSEASPNALLFSRSVNWLRDRPAVANISPKEYGLYRPSPNLKWNNAFYLPVGVTLLSVAGLGAAMWALRRK